MNNGTICEVDGEKWIPGWTTVDEAVHSLNTLSTIPKLSNKALASPRARQLSNSKQAQGLGIGRGERLKRNMFTPEERDRMVKDDILSVRGTNYDNARIEHYVQNNSSDLSTSISDSLSDSDDEIRFVSKKRTSTPASSRITPINSNSIKDSLPSTESLNGYHNLTPTASSLEEESKSDPLSSQISSMSLGEERPFKNSTDKIELTNNSDQNLPKVTKVCRKPRIRNALIDGLLASKCELKSPNYFLTNSGGPTVESQKFFTDHFAESNSIPTSSPLVTRMDDAGPSSHLPTSLYDPEPIYYAPRKTIEASFSLKNDEFPPLS